nr:RecName: Full=Beta-enolase; AltName: Full=2-phospho-D-glycerate hydro-lyase; AltName: Full=Enolase 3; AltName: Full=Muscle-specific enolase; Short=MSE; AltName: Full=Skeletal muscle enolase; AltName: Allergen=Gad m 2.0101 [Gadus morhua]
SITKIKAREIL